MTQKQNSADRGRRSFFLKLGAGASAALASTAGLAKGKSSDAEGLSLKVALLEEEKALRQLHRAFEQALDNGRYDDAVELFANDAEVVFNGGVFKGRGKGIERLFTKRFRAGKTGKRIEPAPGFEPDAASAKESVEVPADLRSATAEFPYSIQVGKPLATESSLASMARLHGEGVETWWEGGIYKVSYQRDAEGSWKIGRLEYETRARADYRPGRSHAGPIVVPSLTARYPEDPEGPDALV